MVEPEAYAMQTSCNSHPTHNLRPVCLAVVVILFIAMTQAQPAPAQKTNTPPAGSRGTAAQNTKQESGRPEAPSVLAQLNNDLESLAAKVSPAVVQILVTGYGPLREEDKSQTALIVRQHAVGSGVIVDSNGYIITNAHVVEGAQRIRVALPLPMTGSSVPVGKRRILEARLLGQHKETDLALLKIDETDLPTLALLTQRPQVGQLVFAIGSPEGLQNSVTMGVVSAVARQADPSKALTYIQTDAPINPGNSGGPLVDMNGAVLGINTFILSQGGGSEGLGFAIPARVVDFVYHSLRTYGHVHRVEIGAVAQEITPTLAEALHLAQHWGVVVSDVIPGGPAAAAGLQIQDIILSADDRRVETLPSLSSALYLHRLDQVVKLEVLRGTEKKILNIPAIEHHDQMDQLLDTVNPETSLIPRLGVLAIDLPGNLASRLGSRSSAGVIVVGRAADLIMPDTGLQAGDIIHQINTLPVDSTDTLRTALGALKSGDPVALQVERDGGLMYVSFEMD
ncbi:Peptidase S1 and S6, chymotrypsin/Hap [Candidatus Sulfotelmatobacter kueseliae]|uniref:Peptidase S1 and S6, chymotrypsin/Hap n=1 Tax=Candidatus Sulfotelmatobacter kueseliae TaxID=2042962 RepID=A0A2U3L614_9BACT|nr:Peptidase S1 and S6, chymotrypsin/Hap [Candidatus Sulfotelmatobacter kueseliae]